MPLYAAITYTPDVDWTAPEQAAEMGEYAEFGQAAAEIMRGGAALFPTATATTVRTSAKGGDVVVTDGPLRRDQGGAHRVLPAGVHRPRPRHRGRGHHPGRVERRRRGAPRHPHGLTGR